MGIRKLIMCSQCCIFAHLRYTLDTIEASHMDSHVRNVADEYKRPIRSS